METLTLARYICELTLQDYDFVQESASKMAASCLLLALKMKDLGGWVSVFALNRDDNYSNSFDALLSFTNFYWTKLKA